MTTGSRDQERASRERAEQQAPVTKEAYHIATRVIIQGRALVRSVQALETIEPSAGFERAIRGLQVKAYTRRLHAIIGTAPPWVGNRIFQASESILDPRAALLGEN